MVACPPNFVDDANGIINNPRAVFEVLSPGTRTLDRGPKFAKYRTLPSLRDFVLIDSVVRRAEVFSLVKEQRMIQVCEEGSASLLSLGIVLDLDELYRYTTLR